MNMNFVSLISVPTSINLDFVTTTPSLEADLSLDHLRIIMTSVSIFDSKNKCPDWCLPHLCGGGKCNKLDRGMQWKILLSSKWPSWMLRWTSHLQFSSCDCIRAWNFIFITKTKPNPPQFITDRKTRPLELDTFSLE